MAIQIVIAMPVFYGVRFRGFIRSYQPVWADGVWIH